MRRTRRLLVLLFFCITPALQMATADLPGPGNSKVAYYVFDSGGPDHYSLTTFTDLANIVVLFEGTLWELADSTHYNSGWMRNVIYHSYSEILRDVRILQSRGVKVLMNVDDAASWSTATPFTTYDGNKLDYHQFAAFIKSCAIDSLHLDGISLDIEHKATANAEYIALLKEIGTYFGPRSSDSASQMYIAAIYAGGAPGSVIGKSKDLTSYMNFIMDMAYFSSNYALRFNQWADSIGASKTMIGVLNDYYDLTRASAAAAWQPAHPPKAGIMVYAANNLKSYTDGVFGALTGVPITEPIPRDLVLQQNYPNPFNARTMIWFSIPYLTATGAQAPTIVDVRLAVYDLLGREVAVLVDDRRTPGTHYVNFDGNGVATGVYVYRLTANGLSQVRKMMLLK